MAAAEGNKYAEKWTAQDAKELAEKAYNAISDDCMNYSALAKKIGVYREVFTHLTRKFKDDKVVSGRLAKIRDRINPACNKAKHEYEKPYSPSERIRERRSIDLGYRLKQNIIALIRYRLKNQSATETINYLPYSISELKTHLEAGFKKGMSWDNYGSVWQIDHVIPVSWFNYKTKEDYGFKQCWRLENLKPMFSQENRKKSNKYSENAQLKILM